MNLRWRDDVGCSTGDPVINEGATSDHEEEFAKEAWGL
jgi:hypothetical protein